MWSLRAPKKLQTYLEETEKKLLNRQIYVIPPCNGSCWGRWQSDGFDQQMMSKSEKSSRVKVDEEEADKNKLSGIFFYLFSIKTLFNRDDVKLKKNVCNV